MAEGEGRDLGIPECTASEREGSRQGGSTGTNCKNILKGMNNCEISSSKNGSVVIAHLNDHFNFHENWVCCNKMASVDGYMFF